MTAARTFTDWSEFLDAADACPRGYDHDPSWFGGVRSHADAIKLARHGWPEGMEYVRRLTMPTVESTVSRRVVDAGWTYDVTGADYDVGEYLSGAPECWLAPQVEEAKPLVTIQVDLTSSMGVPAGVLTRRGAGVTALVLALQSAGYVVECYGLIGLNEAGRDSWFRIPLVDTNGGPLDTDRLVFALAHPVVPRGFGHALAHGRKSSGPLSLSFARRDCPWTADYSLPKTHYDDATWTDAVSVSAWLARTYETLTNAKGA